MQVAPKAPGWYQNSAKIFWPIMIAWGWWHHKFAFSEPGQSSEHLWSPSLILLFTSAGVLTCHLLWYPDLAKQQPWWGFKKFFCKWIQKRLHSAKRSTFAQFFSLFPWRKIFVSQVSLLSAKSCQFAKIFIRLPLPLVEHQKLAFAKKLAGCMTSCRQTGVDRLKRKKPRLWRSGNNWILRSHHCKKNWKKICMPPKKTAPVYCQGKTSTRKWIIKI